MWEAKCKECGKLYIKRRINHLYCSKSCSAKANRRYAKNLARVQKEQAAAEAQRRAKIKTIAQIGEEADKAGLSYGLYVAQTELKKKMRRR